MIDSFRRRLLTAGVLPPMLYACGTKDAEPSAQETAVAATADGVALDITNRGSNEVRINLAFNGSSFFARDEHLSDSIGVGAATQSDLDVALAIWRFLVHNRRHTQPYTAATWAHSPTLLINSIGGGFCDDVASAFAVLGRLAGRETRIWSLSGHVVPEILVDGRWAIFDPDLEVYYLDDNLLPVGLSELAAERRFIEEPILPTAPHWATELLELSALPPLELKRRDSYSSLVADIYASTSDNSTSPSYGIVPQLPDGGLPLFIPPGATLSFGDPHSEAVLSIDGTPLVHASAMTLRLRAGWRGPVRMPFVLRSVRGTGRVMFDSMEFEVGSEALAAALGDRNRYLPELEISGAAGGTVILEYLLNSKRFPIGANDVVEVEGDPLDTLSFHMRPRKGP